MLWYIKLERLAIVKYFCPSQIFVCKVDLNRGVKYIFRMFYKICFLQQISFYGCLIFTKMILLSTLFICHKHIVFLQQK